MRSLRTRLIIGSSAIALVPLAMAMVLLSRRVETLVRAESASRLEAAVGGLQAQLASDAERVSGQLAVLARDPQLRRLYLVRPAGGRDLSDYLVERRVLLGLDYLWVADTNGAWIAEGSAAATDLRPDEIDGDEGVGRPRRFGPAVVLLDAGRGLALGAGAPIAYDNQIVGALHGGLVLDRPFLARLGRINGMELVLRDPQGRVAAGTLDAADSLAAVGSPTRRDESGTIERIVLAGRSYLGRRAALAIGPSPNASVTALVSTEVSDRTLGTLQVATGLLGLLGLALAILLGVLWSSQISRPVERLARFSEQVARGEWERPLRLESVRELETLVQALDRMRADLRGYRDRLLVSERHAAWGQMARKVAHEIKNPLTPIAVSVADLKRSYELGRPEFPQVLDQAVRTIGDEVETLKRLLQEFSDFARFPAPQLAPCRWSSVSRDLETLYGREVAEGRLSFAPSQGDLPFTADAGQLRQALVNLIKNGLEAVDGAGRVSVAATLAGGMLEISVADDGPGLDDEKKSRLFAPGFTTKPHGSGLGLTIVERIVNEHGGTIAVESRPGAGTTFRVRLPLQPDAGGAHAPGETPRT